MSVGDSPFPPATVEDQEVWLLVGVMGREVEVEDWGGEAGMMNGCELEVSGDT